MPSSSFQNKLDLQHCAALRFLLLGNWWLLLITFMENGALHQILGRWVTLHSLCNMNQFHPPPQNIQLLVVAIPSSEASDSYLVEVGGPVLSLLSLSFICELFVCSALHCHTSLANLPNEFQELHNNEGNNKKKVKKKNFISQNCYWAAVLIGDNWLFLHDSSNGYKANT